MAWPHCSNNGEWCLIHHGVTMVTCWFGEWFCLDVVIWWLWCCAWCLAWWLSLANDLLMEECLVRIWFAKNLLSNDRGSLSAIWWFYLNRVFWPWRPTSFWSLPMICRCCACVLNCITTDCLIIEGACLLVSSFPFVFIRDVLRSFCSFAPKSRDWENKTKHAFSLVFLVFLI